MDSVLMWGLATNMSATETPLASHVRKVDPLLISEAVLLSDLGPDKQIQTLNRWDWSTTG